MDGGDGGEVQGGGEVHEFEGDNGQVQYVEVRRRCFIVVVFNLFSVLFCIT